MTLEEIEKFVANNPSLVRWGAYSRVYIDVGNEVTYTISIFGRGDKLYGVHWRIDNDGDVHYDADELYELYRADTIAKLKWLVEKLASL